MSYKNPQLKVTALSLTLSVQLYLYRQSCQHQFLFFRFFFCKQPKSPSMVRQVANTAFCGRKCRISLKVHANFSLICGGGHKFPRRREHRIPALMNSARSISFPANTTYRVQPSRKYGRMYLSASWSLVIRMFLTSNINLRF